MCFKRVASCLVAASPQVSAHPRICWRRMGKASKVGRTWRGREAPISTSEWTLSTLEGIEQAFQQGKKFYLCQAMCRQYLNGRKISFLLIEETEENEPSKGPFIVKNMVMK